MNASNSDNGKIQEKREREWEEFSFILECDGAFRRARLRAFLNSFKRRFVIDTASIKKGQSLIGRRSTDRTRTFCLPIAQISGLVDADGRAFYGYRALSPGLLPVWRRILRQADTLPTPRAYLLGGMWFLEASGPSLLALEAARYLGHSELTVNGAVQALGTLDCGNEPTQSKEKPQPPENARIAS